MNLKPLSSSEGLIQRILITLPPAPDEYVSRYYTELQQAFAHREMVILYRDYEPPRQESPNGEPVKSSDMGMEGLSHAIIEGRDIYEYFAQNNFHEELVGDLVEALKMGVPISNSEWAQDPFCVLTDGNGQSVFLQPLYSRRYMDKFISLKLATMPELGMLIQPTELLLEGGNILAGDGYLLVGKDLLAQNIMRMLRLQKREVASQDIRDELEQRFRREFGVNHVIWVGFERSLQSWKKRSKFTFQPGFHLDLFLTPGGMDEEGRHILFVGDPELSNSILQKQAVRKGLQVAPAIVSQFNGLRGFWTEYEATRTASMPAFKIVPVPLFAYQDVLMPFNNCLVESGGGSRNAYLPDYEVDEADDIYERLNPAFQILKPVMESLLLENGFTSVKWIGPARFFRNLALMQGSLHCITKVLKRTDLSTF
jgi:hypothetical protein